MVTLNEFDTGMGAWVGLMKFSNRIRVISMAFVLFFVLWLIGLTLGWGGWVWIFFIIWLPALVAGMLAFWGTRR